MRSSNGVRGSNSCDSTPAPVSVFVRVRPLVGSEQGVLPGLRTSTTDPDDSAVVLEIGRTQLGGFDGLMGQDSLNRDVFDRCFAGRLLTVLRGGTSSLFCFGYTGSVKTHTVIGYGHERG